jgi:FkbM family methyltransferase
MLETLNRTASRIRNAPVIRDQRWLWGTVEAAWNRLFALASARTGYATRINGEIFRLEYVYGARYDRADKQRYEAEFYAAFTGSVRPGMTVFDIGAHVGIMSLGAARRAGHTGHVFAFEPAPDTLTVLRRHAAYNRDIGRLEVVGVVVSDADGSVPFYTYGESMAASVSRDNVEVLNPEVRSRPAREVLVPSVTLDVFCRERGVRPDIIKIDVEGAELRVLRGARELLTTHKPRVLCEVHPKQMENCGSSLENFYSYLKSVGYGVEMLDTPNPLGIFHSVLTAST